MHSIRFYLVFGLVTLTFIGLLLARKCYMLGAASVVPKTRIEVITIDRTICGEKRTYDTYKHTFYSEGDGK